MHVTIRHILILTCKGFHLNSQFRLGVRMYRFMSQEITWRYSKQCPALDIFNHSLNYKHR